MGRKKIVGIVLGIAFLLIALLAFKVYSVFFKSNTIKDGYLYIHTNSSLTQLDSTALPFLKNKGSFYYVANYVFNNNKIRPGKYQIKTGMSNYEISNLIKRGKQSIVNLSFNNQDTFEKLAGRISKQIESDSISLLKTFTDTTFIKVHHFNKNNALAMYIPNTYQFYWNTTATEFQNKMFKEYEKFWNETRKVKAKNLNLTPLEVTTLASIVQKETATVSERAKVAKLYLNRLNNDWPLQADPTIIYALRSSSKSYDSIKRVLKKDLNIKSPYNTYKNIGLPPGPISMPDISSIDAVLNPANHSYFYMCASTVNPGQHVFATTLAEHNKNALKYRIWLNKIGINR